MFVRGNQLLNHRLHGLIHPQLLTRGDSSLACVHEAAFLGTIASWRSTTAAAEVLGVQSGTHAVLSHPRDDLPGMGKFYAHPQHFSAMQKGGRKIAGVECPG